MLYLIAGNGSPNFGDELIVQNWLRFYRESGYSGPITVDGKGSERSDKLLRGFGDVKFVSRIPRHAYGESGSYDHFYAAGKQFALDNVREFRDVKAFHLLGGGYVSANWYNASRLLGAATSFGRVLSVPVAATGLGIAPFKRLAGRDAEAWKDIVDGCLLFECRDEESYEALVSTTGKTAPSLTFGLDDAFLYAVKSTSRANPWLHLSGFSNSILGNDESILTSLFERFERVIFWTCSKTDAALHTEIAKKYPVVGRYSNERLLNERLPLQRGDFMITGRFHPHLLAARAGLSGYYISESGFYKTKHGLVTELGSPFRSSAGSLEIFEGDSSRMLACDPGRVEEKQRVAKRVLSLLGLK